LYLTAILVLLSLLLRDLNAIAPLITMFFLITYAMINVVVLIEQGLSQVSFRPTFRVPIIVPLLGSAGCFFAMFVINPTVSFVSVGLVLAVYILLMRRKFSSELGDARSGMFNALAEWSAKMVNKLPQAVERSWQPNMIVPAQHIADVVRSYKILFSLAKPKGSIKILGFAPKSRRALMNMRMLEVRNHFMNAEVSCTHAVVEGSDFLSGMIASMQAMRATFFSPNSIFMSLTDDETSDELHQELLLQSHKLGYGSYLYIPYRKVGLGLEKTINLWIKASNIIDIDEKKPAYINLSLLTAYLLRRNWKADLTINILMDKNQKKEDLQYHVDRLYTLSRMPVSIRRVYWQGGLDSVVKAGERGDLNITYMLPSKTNIKRLREISNRMEASYLFTFDSGIENAFA